MMRALLRQATVSLFLRKGLVCTLKLTTRCNFSSSDKNYDDYQEAEGQADEWNRSEGKDDNSEAELDFANPMLKGSLGDYEDHQRGLDPQWHGWGEEIEENADGLPILDLRNRPFNERAMADMMSDLLSNIAGTDIVKLE